jgi:hypothetical protein
MKRWAIAMVSPLIATAAVAGLGFLPAPSEVTVGVNELPDDYDPAAIVRSFEHLHSMETPKHLMVKNAVRNGTEFYVSEYFYVLKHVAPPEGYVLDYVYLFGSEAGAPVLYWRKTKETPFKTLEEYEQGRVGLRNSREIEKPEELNYNRFPELILDGSPESFFEQFVIEVLAGQFYLFWHANTYDTEIVTTREDIERIINVVADYGVPMSDWQMVIAREANIAPRVSWISDNEAVLSVVTFSKWVGLIRETRKVSRKHPHVIKSNQVLKQYY